jgi:hypothetical protein
MGSIIAKVKAIKALKSAKTIRKSSKFRSKAKNSRLRAKNRFWVKKSSILLIKLTKSAQFSIG